jgi:hypothetical protein
MNQDIQSLYQFLLQQHAAEVYINNALRLDEEALNLALVVLGNNRFGFSQQGQTRLTQPQFDEFFARYEIVHQLSDNPTGGGAEMWAGIPLNTGFSATLLYDRVSGKYTFAIRSVEAIVNAMLAAPPSLLAATVLLGHKSTRWNAITRGCAAAG